MYVYTAAKIVPGFRNFFRRTAVLISQEQNCLCESHFSVLA